MSVKVRLNNRAFEAMMNGGTDAGVIVAARRLRTLARKKVNRKYFKSKRVRRDGRQVTVKEKTDASKPGEPPKRRTGAGFRSIEARKVERGVARTYVNKRKAPYMAMYEYGPPDIRRPFLAPTLEENQRELMQLIVSPVKSRMRRGR